MIYVGIVFVLLVASFVAGAIYGRKAAAKAVSAVNQAAGKL